MRLIGGVLVVFAAFFICANMAQGVTLEEVRKRGELNCGASTGIPGFSNPDDQGNWAGLDVDFCKAVAAAAIGDAEKVVFFPLTDKERLTVLYSGDIDLLTRNTPWTMTHDTAFGLNFIGVSYYDGQGFMVSKKMGVKSALELNGAAICFQPRIDDEYKTADYFKENKMEYKSVLSESVDQLLKNFEKGRCDVITDDQSRLYMLRTKMTKPEDGIVLPEVISKEPLGPVVRQGDDAWFNIVRWTLFAMINAEELGISSANIEEMKNSDNPDVQRFLGLKGSRGKGLGLKDDWVYQVIKQVGNYGEVFERNLGQNSALKISRGLNELWSKGGIQYAPPFR